MSSEVSLVPSAPVPSCVSSAVVASLVAAGPMAVVQWLLRPEGWLRRRGEGVEELCRRKCRWYRRYPCQVVCRQLW